MVDGAKMSKSLGNLYTLADLEGKGFSPMAVRYALISGHYRSQLNFTLKSLDDATAALEKIEKAARKLLDKAGITPEEFSQDITVHEQNTAWGAFEPAWTALCDDLNIPGAIGKIFSAFAELNKTELSQADAGTQLCGLAKILSALGIRLFTKQEAAPADIPAEIVALGEQRWAAKQARNWAEADALRNKLAELGWKSLDRKDGYSLEKI